MDQKQFGSILQNSLGGNNKEKHFTDQYIQFAADADAGMGNYYERDRRRTAAHHLVGELTLPGTWCIGDMGMVQGDEEDREI